MEAPVIQASQKHVGKVILSIQSMPIVRWTVERDRCCRLDSACAEYDSVNHPIMWKEYESSTFLIIELVQFVSPYAGYGICAVKVTQDVYVTENQGEKYLLIDVVVNFGLLKYDHH